MKILYVTNSMSRHLSICVLRESILTLVARGFVTRLTRRVSLVEQELLTLPKHLNSPPVFNGVHVTRTLVVSPIRRGFVPGFVNYKKGRTRIAPASVKVYQLLAHGRWFSPGIPASSTTKTGRHVIAEILLKVALNIINQIKITCWFHTRIHL